ncbi:DUF2742 domain-containing protein [Mycolicibacterium sp. 141076]|uniref:DUF2742 domain-containing protein n=1 Tax=Mycolicibacterium sp. 141076 TaxID=3090599 RepID=UPI00299ED2CB|nr:DUF2742 domain-containing protein [Mycolicibacterium sp. 141076]MDX1878215.1 DUF2742 domain-containing protein [Mycolicibacterium sp. 141076]
MAHKSRIGGSRHRTILRAKGIRAVTNAKKGASPSDEAGPLRLTTAVDWWPAYRFVAAYAQQHQLPLDHYLIAGSAEWCQLPDTDTRKLLSLMVGGIRDALTQDARTEAWIEASIAISTGGENWTTQAQRIRNRASSSYVPRRTA